MWTEVTAPQVTLTQGQTYAASLVLTGLEAMFGSVDAVKGKFTDLGFTNVTVWEVPPAWMPDQMRPTSGKGYWARGTWGKATTARPMPPEVNKVWRQDADAPAATPPAAAPPTDDAAAAAANYAAIAAQAARAGDARTAADAARAAQGAAPGSDAAKAAAASAAQAAANVAPAPASERSMGPLAVLLVLLLLGGSKR